MTERSTSIRRLFRRSVWLGVAALSGMPAHAADNALLIQMEAAGKFRVWHAEGETNLTEQELSQLEVNAAPEGGSAIETRFGPARAYETADGIVVKLPNAQRDKRLLLDRQACSDLKAWHAEGATQLTDDQVADLVVTAAPNGGTTLTVGGYQARAYSTKLGVLAMLWKKVVRQPLP